MNTETATPVAEIKTEPELKIETLKNWENLSVELFENLYPHCPLTSPEPTFKISQVTIINLKETYAFLEAVVSF